MGLGDLSGAVSQGSSAQSSWNQAQAQAWSATQAQAAREWSAKEAQISRDWQEAMFNRQMEYNASEAEKQRVWEQGNINIANEMANTVYTRAAKNMQEAGINPILAYTAGLGGVGSGATSGGAAATASLPSGAMGQSFMDQQSASSSYSHGQSSGSSWQESESGLATGLQLMGQALGDALKTMNTGNTINLAMDKLSGGAKATWEDIKLLMIDNLPNNIVKFLGLNSNQSSTSGEAPKRNKTITGSGTINGTSHSGGGTKF